MISKKVDIIVPIYNKSSFLPDLLLSFIKMPSDLFNIILVDDGSIDESISVIEEFINTHDNIENIFLYKKINGGVSSARNYGIKKSVSEYIWFFDPDDKVHEDFYKKIDLIENIHQEIVVFNHTLINQKGDEIQCELNSYGEIKSKDFFMMYDALLKNNKNMNLVWNKWYKRNYVEGIYFDINYELGEDRKFNIDIFSQDGKVLLLNIFIYKYYFYGSNTLSTQWTEKKIQNLYDVNYLNMKYYNYNRDICKAHILEQTKIRITLREKGLFNFYINEHKKLKTMIFPFSKFHDFVVFILLVFRVQNISYTFFKAIKKYL